jgi:hypothetical protein
MIVVFIATDEDAEMARRTISLPQSIEDLARESARDPDLPSARQPRSFQARPTSERSRGLARAHLHPLRRRPHVLWVARLVRVANTLRRAVAAIARDEGFTVNESKSMLATRAGRQRVCGVIVNEHVNVPRREYDVLKAILHNSAVHGPASQNREALPDFHAHLLGRISWVGSLNPMRGEKLRRQLAAITWQDPH